MSQEELIEELAEKVMGWKLGTVFLRPSDSFGLIPVMRSVWFDHQGKVCYKEDWNPLSCRDDAWKIVDKLRREGCQFEMSSPPKEEGIEDITHVCFTKDCFGCGEGETDQLAICKAALRFTEAKEMFQTVTV